MKQLLNKITKLKNYDYEALGKFVSHFDFKKLDFRKLIPQPEGPGDYARNVLMEDPIEVVLLYWPPGAYSAIHHHEGFYGYVKVMEGACQDVVYELDDNTLKEKKVTQCFAGGIIDEPDGVIHKLANPSDKMPLVTIHIYYPPLKSMEDMRLFDIENERIGILSGKAKSASWKEKEGHFKEIIDNAFTFQTPEHSHNIVIVKPKPEADIISELITDYYDEQAHEYDNFDLEHPTRKPYTDTINRLIAEDLAAQSEIAKYLSIACGTGRRATSIRKQADKKFAIYGVDMSAEMCRIASSKGIFATNKKWLDADMKPHAPFDVVTFLFAFGHIPTSDLREKTLKKIHQMLKPGGVLYFDAFNLEDQNEWGPYALNAFQELNLEKHGYDRGDVFYQKTGGKATAFLHYFIENELTDLVENAGFRIEEIKYIGYVSRSGEIVKSKTEGFFFIKAIKK